MIIEVASAMREKQVVMVSAVNIFTNSRQTRTLGVYHLRFIFSRAHKLRILGYNPEISCPRN
jgi:hypothetical protein